MVGAASPYGNCGRWQPNGEPFVARRPGSVVVGTLITQPHQDRPADLAEWDDLLRSELVEDPLPHGRDMPGSGGLQCGEPGVGQYREGSTLVRRAGAPPHPADLFEAGHRVRQPAARRAAGTGQLAHPQRTI